MVVSMQVDGDSGDQQRQLSEVLMADWVTTNAEQPWMHTGLLQLAHQVIIQPLLASLMCFYQQLFSLCYLASTGWMDLIPCL